ncbi:type II toxin-antitoxin system RelE/ParE family toxin [uncultured Salinisphaera sp.]|uniref:type II toxin-antitoxin system RelE/ParE family toxin n=1 Tax=uncultured Salinisphaera sp. TaxID=359372 RepID=UPI0032B144D6|tara:strand:+ start:4568 stop:4912 length:345 start_codon:yes stop_codon:yes gene_type:complete
MDGPSKSAAFVGRALDEIRSFPEPARQDAGYQLHRVQHGLDPSDWKPLTGVGKGVREIRIWQDDGTYRVIYVASINSAVYVLHAFQKKDDKTRQANIDVARRRYKALMQELNRG